MVGGSSNEVGLPEELNCSFFLIGKSKRPHSVWISFREPEQILKLYPSWGGKKHQHQRSEWKYGFKISQETIESNQSVRALLARRIAQLRRMECTSLGELTCSPWAHSSSWDSALLLCMYVCVCLFVSATTSVYNYLKLSPCWASLSLLWCSIEITEVGTVVLWLWWRQVKTVKVTSCLWLLLPERCNAECTPLSYPCCLKADFKKTKIFH